MFICSICIQYNKKMFGIKNHTVHLIFYKELF